MEEVSSSPLLAPFLFYAFRCAFAAWIVVFLCSVPLKWPPRCRFRRLRRPVVARCPRSARLRRRRCVLRPFFVCLGVWDRFLGLNDFAWFAGPVGLVGFAFCVHFHFQI